MENMSYKDPQTKSHKASFLIQHAFFVFFLSMLGINIAQLSLCIYGVLFLVPSTYTKIYNHLYKIYHLHKIHFPFCCFSSSIKNRLFSLYYILISLPLLLQFLPSPSHSDTLPFYLSLENKRLLRNNNKHNKI